MRRGQEGLEKHLGPEAQLQQLFKSDSDTKDLRTPLSRDPLLRAKEQSPRSRWLTRDPSGGSGMTRKLSHQSPPSPVTGRGCGPPAPVQCGWGRLGRSRVHECGDTGREEKGLAAASPPDGIQACGMARPPCPSVSSLPPAPWGHRLLPRTLQKPSSAPQGWDQGQVT